MNTPCVNWTESALVNVAVQKGDDKFTIFEEALELSGFLEHIDGVCQDLGKSRHEFSVVVKPNMMMYSHKEDPQGTYTDIELVERLFDLLFKEGYRDLKLVESQNVYGNWYQKRDVVNVARVSGHKPEEHHYEVVDLTVDSEKHQYNGRWLTEHPVGVAWRDADYRISFAKNKTHIYDYYTLTLKNIYGVTPKQDKMLHYHGLKEWYGATYDTLKCFPVHFGIIDAIWSADGLLGFKGTTNPKHTKIIVASPSIIAADIVGAEMMGRDPRDSLLMSMCQDEWGTPTVERVGNVPEDYTHEGWNNIDAFKKVDDPEKFRDLFGENIIRTLLKEDIPRVAGVLLQIVSTLFEESYLSITIGGLVTGRMASDYMDTNDFPMKPLDETLGYVLEHSIQNVVNLFTGMERHRSLRWEFGHIWKSLLNLSVGRPLSKALENSQRRLEDSLEKQKSKEQTKE